MARQDASWRLTVHCAGCGAELVVEPDRRFVDCDFCGASSVLDLGAAATCFRVRGTLGEEAAIRKLRGWLRGKGLQEKEIDIKAVSLLLVPFWVLEAAEGKVSLLAAERADLPFSPDVRTPVGQLEGFDPEEMDGEDATLIEWTIPLGVATMRLVSPDAVGARADEKLRPSLLYAPFFSISYSYAKTPYEAFVDACSGGIHVISRPRARDQTIDRKLLLLLGAAVTAFLGCAVFVPGFWAVLGLYLLVSLPIAWGLTRTIVAAGSRG